MSLLRRVVRKLRPENRSPIEYSYEGFSILLTPDHKLPACQARYPDYDRFLPHLARFLGEGDAVIDIGANVGDSLAAMCAVNALPSFVCIEADDEFYGYLQRNIERIRTRHPELRVHTIRALVGTGARSGRLEGSGGTRHFVDAGAGELSTQALGQVLAGLPELSYRVLKSDVDGYDYDVLLSSGDVIDTHKPLLYFESQADFDYQKAGYESLLTVLHGKGYRDYALFDNFGALLLRTSELSAVRQLLDYVWRQNTGRSARTMYYLDILAATDSDADFVTQVLADY